MTIRTLIENIKNYVAGSIVLNPLVSTIGVFFYWLNRNVHFATIKLQELVNSTDCTMENNTGFVNCGDNITDIELALNLTSQAKAYGREQAWEAVEATWPEIIGICALGTVSTALIISCLRATGGGDEDEEIELRPIDEPLLLNERNSSDIELQEVTSKESEVTSMTRMKIY